MNIRNLRGSYSKHQSKFRIQNIFLKPNSTLIHELAAGAITKIRKLYRAGAATLAPIWETLVSFQNQNSATRAQDPDKHVDKLVSQPESVFQKLATGAITKILKFQRAGSTTLAPNCVLSKLSFCFRSKAPPLTLSPRDEFQKSNKRNSTPNKSHVVSETKIQCSHHDRKSGRYEN